MHGVPEALLTPQSLAGIEPFACGPVMVHPGERVVRGPTRDVSIQPRAMQVLAVLGLAAGRVVTRGELLRRCWGASWAGDDSLNRAVGEIRRALERVCGDAVQIETVPRTGYRLIDQSSHHASPAVPEPGHGQTEQEVAPRPSSRVSRRAIVAGAIGATGVIAVGGWALRSSSDSAAVRALIAQGHNAMQTGMPDAALQGVGFLQEAVRLAPNSATAWGKLALAQTFRAEHAAPDEVGEAVLGAQQAAARALALESDQPDAMAALAILPPYFGAWAEAETRMKAVLAVHPKNFPTLDAWWFLKMGTGQTRDGAIRRIAFAAAEPLNAGHQQRLMYAYHLLGRHAEGDRVADRALSLWPKHPGLWLARLLTFVMTDRVPRARAHLEDEAGRPDLPPHVLLHCRTWLRALETRAPADIEAVIAQVIEQFAQGPSAAVLGVLHMVSVSRVDLAMDMARGYLLEQGPLIAGVRWRPGQISMNDQKRRKTHMLFLPAMAPLRAHPEFDRLMKQIGLDAYWAAAGIIPDYRRPPASR